MCSPTTWEHSEGLQKSVCVCVGGGGGKEIRGNQEKEVKKKST